jgi:hypothetical protein
MPGLTTELPVASCNLKEGGTVEPGQRVGWESVKVTPGSQEGVRHHIFGHVVGNPAASVGQDMSMERPEHVGEALVVVVHASSLD